MFGPISFRRILLSRILLLSVPVLLIGQFVTYRQVRLSLLETMHDSLVQSAQRKGEDLSRFVTTLRLSASVAREAASVTAGDFNESTIFFKRLLQQLPDSVECIWLESIATGQVLANTCSAIDASVPTYQPPPQALPIIPSSSETALPSSESAIEIGTFFMPIHPTPTAPPPSHSTPSDTLAPTPPPIAAITEKRTYFLLNAPVIPPPGTPPQYVLRLIAQLPSEHRNQATLHTSSSGLVSNATLIVNASHTVLSYPLNGYVGRDFSELPDYSRLMEQTRESAAEFAQRTVFSGEIFHLDHQTRQAIVGHILIPDPTISTRLRDSINFDHSEKSEDPQWIVMAVADLELALQNLAGVRSVMFNLVLLLLAANLAATLFLTRDLARPLERLGR